LKAFYGHISGGLSVDVAVTARPLYEYPLDIPISSLDWDYMEMEM
jgi:hypothetical protein